MYVSGGWVRIRSNGTEQAACQKLCSEKQVPAAAGSRILQREAGSSRVFAYSCRCLDVRVVVCGLRGWSVVGSVCDARRKRNLQVMFWGFLMLMGGR
jgi:hypothetical protein